MSESWFSRTAPSPTGGDAHRNTVQWNVRRDVDPGNSASLPADPAKRWTAYFLKQP